MSSKARRAQERGTAINPVMSTPMASLLQQGIEYHQSGNLPLAAVTYQQVLAQVPQQPDALHLLGVVHHQEGDHQAAIDLINQSVKRNPKNADAHSNLGAALTAVGEFDAAAKSFQRAIRLKPDYLDAHANLAALSVRRGDDKAAIRSFKAANKLRPEEPRFIKRLGELCLNHGQYDEAIDWFLKFLSSTPDDAEVHNNLAFACQNIERLGEAEVHYRRALALDPDKPEICNNLAITLNRLGKKDEASELFDRLFKFDAERWDDPSHHAGALYNNRSTEKALNIYETLVSERPDDAILHRDFGEALYGAGKSEAAKGAFKRALELDSSMDSVSISLAHCYLRDREIEPALDALQSVHRSSAYYLSACLDLCLVYAGTERLEEACKFARKAARHPNFRPSMFIKPYTVYRKACAFDDIEKLTGDLNDVSDQKLSSWANVFLELLVYANTEDKIGDLAALHRRWGEILMNSVAHDPIPYRFRMKGTGKIRLGFVSSDLRKHSVARFVMPLFENYDQEQFEIYCYAPVDEKDDEIQQRIKNCVTAFQIIGDLSYRETAEKIQDDDIDILFELNGFTADSRLNVMAYHPAPVQVYWLGYPFTTGLPAMDYILVDEEIAPARPEWLTEKPLLMPDSWICYDPFETTMPLPDPPVTRNGYVTFGTLNNPYKFTRTGIANWANVMRAVPDSGFLFVHDEFEHSMIAENLAEEFGRNGVSSDRLQFVGSRESEISHFAYYDEIDISLDPAPLTGGTSTTDALWMGVPVVTLVGPSLHQRLSNGILSKVGLRDLCAETPEDFVSIATALAGDVDRLTRLRRDLRQTMKSSPLCNAQDFCKSFQALMMEVVARHELR